MKTKTLGDPLEDNDFDLFGDGPDAKVPGTETVTEEPLEKLFQAAREGTLPEGFDQWHRADDKGWTVAHVAASYGYLPEEFKAWGTAAWGLSNIDGYTVAHEAARAGILPEDFEYWAFKDKNGNTVAKFALDSYPEGSLLHAKAKVWLENASTEELLEKLFQAAREGALPEDFDQWEFANNVGLSVAHVAAHSGTLPQDFEKWGIKDNRGWTVAQFALDSYPEDSPFHAKAKAWLEKEAVETAGPSERTSFADGQSVDPRQEAVEFFDCLENAAVAGNRLAIPEYEVLRRWLARFDNEATLTEEYNLSVRPQKQFGGKELKDLSTKEKAEARAKAERNFFAREYEKSIAANEKAETQADGQTAAKENQGTKAGKSAVSDFAALIGNLAAWVATVCSNILRGIAHGSDRTALPDDVRRVFAGIRERREYARQQANDDEGDSPSP
jgi:hypothetical protein